MPKSPTRGVNLINDFRFRSSSWWGQFTGAVVVVEVEIVDMKSRCKKCTQMHFPANTWLGLGPASRAAVRVNKQNFPRLHMQPDNLCWLAGWHRTLASALKAQHNVVM